MYNVIRFRPKRKPGAPKGGGRFSRFPAAAGLLLSFAMLAVPCHAQERALRFDRVTVEDGLAHGTVRAIHQDARGFMWLGTDEGLNRYDGYHFRSYRHDPDDPRSLSGNNVQAIYSDSRGQLWIGTNSGGLDRLRDDGGTFAHYRHDPDDPTSLSDNEVTRLVEDTEGNLWVGTANGLSRFRPREAPFPEDYSAESSLKGHFIFDLHHDPSGELWIATDGGLVRLPDPRRTEGFVHYRHDPSVPGGLSSNQVWAIEGDPDGSLWIGTDQGLERFDPGDGSVVPYRHDPERLWGPSGSEVVQLLMDRRGELWIGTGGSGLVRFDRARGTFSRSLHNSADLRSLADNFVLSLFEDATGVLWVGSYTNISRYDPVREPFLAYLPRRDSTLSQDDTWALLEDHSGVLWIGTSANGLDRFDRRRRTVVNYRFDSGDPGSLQSGPVTTLHQDRAGDLWVGTWDGLSRLQRPLPVPPERPRFVHYRPDPDDPHSLRTHQIQKIYEDRVGRLWIGTLSGLHHFDRAGGRFVRYPRDPGDPGTLATDAFYAIHENRAGDLWFGSETGGIYRLRGDSSEGDGEPIENYRHDPADRDSLSGRCCGEHFRGSFGDALGSAPSARASTAWLPRSRDNAGASLATGSETDCPATRSSTSWRTATGGSGSPPGHGLSRFDPRSETFKNYDVSDGLHGNVFAAVCAYHSPSGEMFFGGGGRLHHLLPGAGGGRSDGAQGRDH